MSEALQKIIKDLRAYSEWAGKPDVLEQAISALEAQQAPPLGAPIAAEYAAELAMLSTDAEALQAQYERGLKDGAQQAQAPTQAEVDLNEALLEVDYWKRIVAHLAAPVGYKLVPVKPTHKMIEAMVRVAVANDDPAITFYRKLYQAMLEAAPQQGSKT